MKVCSVICQIQLTSLAYIPFVRFSVKELSKL